MSSLIIEPHYLGSLEYYTLLLRHDNILFEVNDRFVKQTYRSRTYFLGANGVQMLSIPLVYDSQTITKDVKIDYNQRWLKDHWGAYYSAYGKAPFFEYFEKELYDLWHKKTTFLVDLNVEMMQFVSKVVGVPKDYSFTETYEENTDHRDFRNKILPKKNYAIREIYFPTSYTQLFGTAFTPNLSIIDLIMCCGRESVKLLKDSSLVQ